MNASKRLPRMLSLFPELAEQGIDYIDVGCREGVELRWRPFSRLLNYTGFDADPDEVARMEREPVPYRSRRLFPLAIGGTTGSAVLHRTDSPFCWSLLVPRRAWLKRLQCGEAFVKTGESKVQVVTLDDVAQRESLRADVLKLDSQGLELPILRAAEKVLPGVFCVESETGFVENYVGETLTAQIDEFMRAHGFLMFDLKFYRMGRNNALASRSIKQPFYCETVWLRDYLSKESWDIPTVPVERPGAIKALAICWVLGFPDYGVELAEHFFSLGLISDSENAALHSEQIWEDKPTSDPTGRLLVNAFRLLPYSVRRPLASILRRLADASGTAVTRSNLLKAWIKQGI